MKALNTNKIVYKVIVQRAFLPDGRENEIILRTAKILEEFGEKRIDSVPVTFTAPFVFTDVSDAELDKFKHKLGVNTDATVENCISAMKHSYKLSEDLTPEEIRVAGGVRFEMQIRDFSFNNRYTFAEDISVDTVMRIKEERVLLPGIDIVEEPMRIYLDATIAPHIRGNIGAISSEEYETLKEQGYTLNDITGKNGIEQAMENILRGTNGIRTIVRNSQGIPISDETTSDVKTGNSIKLTIDSKFQKDVQQILEDGINWLHHSKETVANPRYQRGQHTEGGAIAVLDVRNGKVLALANYPSYDINDYIENYGEVLNAPGQPLFNRATSGLYRPGSTFKTITGFSGLINGVIDINSTVVCNRVYTFYRDYQPHCTGTHGSISILNALKFSCNVFFYDVGRRTGIDKFSETASRMGIGQNLGLETGGASGKMTTPEMFKKITGNEFSGGDVLQAAIGQSETMLTPLHLAVQAMAFANDGTRYKPYLVDSVWNYEGTEKISETLPVIADRYAADQKNAYAIIREGMTRVTTMAVWPPDNMSRWIFDYLPDTPAFKTGTPEAGADGKLNSAIMGYYPAHNPVIAYGIVLENSDFSRYLVRNIIDAYFYDAYEPDLREDGVVKSPWKRWDADKQARMSANARNY